MKILKLLQTDITQCMAYNTSDLVFYGRPKQIDAPANTTFALSRKSLNSIIRPAIEYNPKRLTEKWESLIKQHFSGSLYNEYHETKSLTGHIFCQQ